MAVLPRRAWRGRMIADAHRSNAMGVGWAEGSVTVAKQMTWRFIPRERVSHLPSDQRAVGLVVTLIVTSRLRA